MPKITNITPDEREQAIYTIGKLGEEVTDERIEYYVQLHRNTVKHQEENANNEAVNQISEQIKEFAWKVLSYLERDTSDREIIVYSRKHIETLSYIKEKNLDIDYTPSLFGEAIRFMEEQKSTTIHHLTAEDLANCINDKKEELLNKRKQVEAKIKAEGKKREWRKKEKNEDLVKKAILLKKIALCGSVILVLAPFFITGFGFGWFWYLLIIGVIILCLALMGTDGSDKGDYSLVKSILISFCVVGCLMYLWGPLNPNYERSGGSNAMGFSSSEDNGDVRYYDGQKLRKQYVKCADCGNTLWYWQSESSSLSLEKPDTWHGEYYCGSCYRYKKDMEGVAKEAAKKFGGGW